MMRCLSVLLVALALPASAQDPGIQKTLIQRQQQSDAFTLQLRQSQERLQAPAGDLKRQRELDARQVSETQALENLGQQQLRDVKPDTPQELRPYERQKTEDERRPLTVPAKVAAPRTGDEPRPLPAAPRGIIQGIDALR